MCFYRCLLTGIQVITVLMHLLFCECWIRQQVWFSLSRIMKIAWSFQANCGIAESPVTHRVCLYIIHSPAIQNSLRCLHTAKSITLSQSHSSCLLNAFYSTFKNIIVFWIRSFILDRHFERIFQIYFIPCDSFVESAVFWVTMVTKKLQQKFTILKLISLFIHRWLPNRGGRHCHALMHHLSSFTSVEHWIYWSIDCIDRNWYMYSSSSKQVWRLQKLNWLIIQTHDGINITERIQCTNDK